ncbi:MAG TPA: HAMP domain-containing protein, partial [Acidobacteriaceae bacterium]|nr:HAMP domain-containing protein [Acidobacteriaceae bacterium]
MARLFLKVFLGFWATVISVGIALVLSFVFTPSGSYLPWQDARSTAREVIREMDRHGPAAAARVLSRLERSQGLQACLYDDQGMPIAGNHCGPFRDAPMGAPMPDRPTSSGTYRNIMRLPSANGKVYVLTTELPWGPRQIHRTISGFALHWLVVLLVSSAICYLLTLRLTRPILRLREASRQISEGNLHARVPPRVEARGDEFGDLARDFNTMAERIEDLLSSQRQLISDVS